MPLPEIRSVRVWTQASGAAMLQSSEMPESAQPLVLHPDRFFDSDPAIRRAARSLYEETRDLPLVCPHGHVDASLLAENEPFPEPTDLIIVGGAAATLGYAVQVADFPTVRP